MRKKLFWMNGIGPSARSWMREKRASQTSGGVGRPAASAPAESESLWKVRPTPTTA